MKLLPVARPAAFIAGALACAIAAAGCTSGGSAAPGGPASSSAASAATGQAGELHWHSCPIPPAEMRCASLQVPLDYRHPAGRKITLAVSEMPATAPAAQQQGYLLVNPGGPGASGLSLAADVAAGLDPTVASEYNIIGFDPRGVGSSVPALHCDPSFFAGVRPDYIPANAHAEQVLLGRAKSYAAGCQRRYGWLLPFMTTADTARDMDSIRAALGAAEDQLLRLLLGHLPGAGVRDPVPAPAAPDGARQRGEPAGCLVRRQHRPGLRVRGQDTGVLLLDRRPRRRLPPRLHPGPGPAGVVPGPGQARGPPDRRPDRPDDRPRRVRRHLPGGRLHQRRVAGPGHRAGRLPPPARQRPHGRGVPDAGGAEREREPVRGLQRGAVQRRQLAAELGEMGRRHQAGLPDGAVRGLGQRLVQRRLRVLAGAGPGPAAADPRRRGCPAS